MNQAGSTNRLKSKSYSTLVLVLLGCGICYSQATQSMESNKKGLEILRASFAAHGGIYAVDSLRIKFSVINQKNITQGQTYAADEKGDEYVAEGIYAFDKRKKQESAWVKTPMSGFEFVNEQIVANGKGLRISHDTKSYQESPAIRVSTHYLPQFVIAEMLKSPFSIRFLGESTEHGVQVNWVSGVRNGEYVEIAIDQKSMWIHSVRQLTQIPGVGGDTERELLFQDYVVVGGVAIAQSVEIRQSNTLMGTVSNTFNVRNITDKFAIDEARTSPAKEYVRQDFSYRKNAAVVPLAKDIYMIENSHGAPAYYPFSYNVLFAEFKDFVLVVEAPWDGEVSQRVIKLIQNTIPNKPIRYLVQTHHHEDHIGGIRTYIANGVKIITSPSNVNFINSIAAVRFHAYPDILTSKPVTALIEPVSGKRLLLKDTRNEAIIQDIGPNIHTKENLVVYFPAQKLLYQADMINEGEYPLTATSNEFLGKLKELQWPIETMVGTHGKNLTKEALIELLGK